MKDDRRLRDDEVREILDRAVEADSEGGSAAAGLSLTDLEEIAGEVGFDPRRIAEAAAALQARRDVVAPRRSFGMKVSVDRVVDLPRVLTDTEWERLVGELRGTFGAAGWVDVHGNLREWSNGNLYVLTDTGESGPQLRMGSMNGAALRSNPAGAVVAAVGVVLLLASLLEGGGALSEDGMLVVVLLLAGLGTLLFNALRLPRWVDERQAQFESISAWVARLGESGEPVERS